MNEFRKSGFLTDFSIMNGYIEYKVRALCVYLYIIGVPYIIFILHTYLGGYT